MDVNNNATDENIQGSSSDAFLFKRQIRPEVLKNEIERFTKSSSTTSIIRQISNSYGFKFDLFIDDKLVRIGEDSLKGPISIRIVGEDIYPLVKRNIFDEAIQRKKKFGSAYSGYKLNNRKLVTQGECSNCFNQQGPFRALKFTNLPLCFECSAYYKDIRILRSPRKERRCSNTNCKKLSHDLKKGLCNSCDMYKKSHGIIRPFALYNSPCKNGCGRNTFKEICVVCKHKSEKSTTSISRSCIVCNKEVIVRLTKATLTDNWKCRSCQPSHSPHLGSEFHCQICTNRLYKASNEKHPNYSDLVCVKCVLFPILKDGFLSEECDPDNYEEIYIKNLNHFEKSIKFVDDLFLERGRMKINYMYLSEDCKEDCSFDDFIAMIKYIGFGQPMRKFTSLKQMVGTSNGLYLFEYKSRLSEGMAKWIEKGGIKMCKTIGCDRDTQNQNIASGIGRLTSLEDHKILNYIGIITLFDAYLKFQISDKESLFFSKEAIAKGETYN